MVQFSSDEGTRQSGNKCWAQMYTVPPLPLDGYIAVRYLSEQFLGSKEEELCGKSLAPS